MTEMLEVMISAAQDAAEVVREVYDTQFHVHYKAPRDPVTAADRRANDLIVNRLSAAFPDIPIVAEESDPAAFDGYHTADRVFFVDPLDGTREFIDRNGEFVVMIGMVDGTRATLGVVHAPAQRRAWAGAIGAGAFFWEEGGARQRITVSDVSALGEARVVASRSHRSPDLERAFDLLGGRELIALGSAGLKGSEIAMGKAEIYVGPGRAGKLWDACAVDAIVCAAGGEFSDVYGERYDYRANSLDNTRGILATNGRLHGLVLERLRELF